MKALVYHGTLDVRYEDFPDGGELLSHDVRLKVHCAALCHTDFNEYMNGPIFVSKDPHPRTGRSIPLILGHEFSGEIVETGKSVNRVRQGDRVAINCVDACRGCFHCRRGSYAVCPSAAYIGFGRDGGFAQFAVVPEACCYGLKPQVSYRAGALVEPLSVAIHAVQRARLGAGSRVAIVGGGALGLCTLQALRALGASDVFVVEKSEAKRQFASQLGASATIDPLHADPAGIIRDLTDGLGADAAFECAGSAAAFRTATEVTRGEGTICVEGIFPGPFEFDYNSLLAQEKTVVASLAYGEEFPTTIAMLADNRLRAEPLITRTVPLSGAREALVAYEEFAPATIRTLIEIN